LEKEMRFKGFAIFTTAACLLGGSSPVLADSLDSTGWTPAGVAAESGNGGSQMVAESWVPAGAAPVAVASVGSTEVAGWVPAGAAPGTATDVAMQDAPDPMPRRVADLAP
jgi:hypothetical protein